MFKGNPGTARVFTGFDETVLHISALFGGRWLRKGSRLWMREKLGNMRAVPEFPLNAHRMATYEQ